MQDTSETKVIGAYPPQWADDEFVRVAAVEVSMRLQVRMSALAEEHREITEFLGQPHTHLWADMFQGEVITNARKFVITLHDWELPRLVRAQHARRLARVLFGDEHPDLAWWRTLTGINMAYAIGYTHPTVPLASAPALLNCNRAYVHRLRTTRGLELTAAGLYEYFQHSADWKQKARALEHA